MSLFTLSRITARASLESRSAIRSRTSLGSRRSISERVHYRSFFNVPGTTAPKSFSETRIVPFPVDLAFSVVADVESYASFVPWCVSSHVTSRTPTSLEAQLTAGFGPVSSSYVSRVTLDDDPASTRKRITAVAIDFDLFTHLTNVWEFTSLSPHETELKFRVDFQFASPLHEAVAHVHFDSLAAEMVEAFTARCGTVSASK